MKNWVYTNLAAKNALTLWIDDVPYDVSQYSASFACNEIPTASCMLAVGRNARTQIEATIHDNSSHTQMVTAFVTFTPQEEYSRLIDWPIETTIIFEGFFTGFALRKINGKIHVVANLIHWLAGLAMSSCLTKNGHVANPTQLNAASVIRSLADPGAAAGCTISRLAPLNSMFSSASTDLWAGIKDIFCRLANVATLPCGDERLCGGTGSASINDFALPYLRMIEGFIPPPPILIGPPVEHSCSTPYVYGVPLPVVAIPRLVEAVADAVAGETVDSYASFSFWDKLVGQFCPMFGMAVVPMISSALVIADTPTLRSGKWKTLLAEDYDAFDMSGELHRPLRAVGVMAIGDSPTQAGMAEYDTLSAIGGCYAEDSVAPGDGMVLFVGAPVWLRSLHTMLTDPGQVSGLSMQAPIRTATTPNSNVAGPTTTPGTFGEQTNELYRRYAHTVYVNQVLRGRNGSFSGKLRFDIAPGSIIQLNGTTEAFIGPGQDGLGVNIFGCVQRVTIVINCEASMAGTTFTLSHIRTETENGINRTSTSTHPLFGNAIHGEGLHGCPLHPLYDLP